MSALQTRRGNGPSPYAARLGLVAARAVYLRAIERAAKAGLPAAELTEDIEQTRRTVETLLRQTIEPFKIGGLQP